MIQELRLDLSEVREITQLGEENTPVYVVDVAAEQKRKALDTFGARLMQDASVRDRARRQKAQHAAPERDLDGQHQSQHTVPIDCCPELWPVPFRSCKDLEHFRRVKDRAFFTARDEPSPYRFGKRVNDTDVQADPSANHVYGLV